VDKIAPASLNQPADGPAPSGARPFSIVIVGGGAAGITVAAELRRHRKNLSIAIIEPSETHAYQPGWTLVGAGVFSLRQTLRREGSLIPKGVTWIKGAVATFLPDANLVALQDGEVISYQLLVVCPGLQLDWGKVDGLQETLCKNGVCSNYSAASAEYTWDCIRAFNGGTALFTQPPMPIKCAGAPQKIMYLAADRWRRQHPAKAANIEFCLAGDVLFGVPFFVPPLQKAVTQYGIHTRFKQNLVAVDGTRKVATFETIDADGKASRITRNYDMIHVTPPQSAPDFIKRSDLANATGWVEVDTATLQHPRRWNVFALGDVAGTSNAKTAAAVRLQAPVVVRNLLTVMDGKTPAALYDGYGSCPLTTAYGEVVLAEFAYGGKVTPSFPIDPRKPRRSAWLLKTRFLPFLYWHLMLRGSEFDITHKERHFADTVPA
jgi:sulfide:quinone oxidoreductase